MAPGENGMRLRLRGALATGRRATDAAATAALSMMRLPIISTIRLEQDVVGGDGGDLPGELVLAGGLPRTCEL